MKRILTFAVMLILLCAQAALADSDWLIADSDTRLLTAEELWAWDFESLGYIEYEIYARHGYRFRSNNVYGEYFSDKDWYVPNPRNNIDGCFAELTEIEQQNVALITQVQMEMLSKGSLNLENGRSVWTKMPSVPALAFEKFRFKAGQSLAVYSAPSTKAWRGANSRAQVSTNGDVWVAGRDGDWLLIYYETNKGSVRVGYISSSKLRDDVSAIPALELAGTQAVITAKCGMTDDMIRNASSMTTIAAGKTVTYLAPCYADNGVWAYIETTVSKKTARGFVPMDCIDISLQQ